MKSLLFRLAPAGLLVTLWSASASAGTAVALSAKNDDLFLGFHATSGTGATQDYLLDIGAATQFENATGPFVLNLGNIASDLTAFGTTWQSDANLLWGVFGSNTSGGATAGNDPANTLFASRAHGGTPLTSATNSTQRSTTTKYTSLSNAYVTNFSSQQQNFSTTNSPEGLLQNTTDANSYASFQPSNNSFGLGVSTENSFAGGTAGATLDLYRLEPAVGSPAGVELGTLSISNSGAVTFSSVPEPSSLALLGGAAVLLGWRRDRRGRRRPAAV